CTPDAHPAARATRFFFSSRSRHTTFSRDWSSDVCSSDLTVTSLLLPAPVLPLAGETDSHGMSAATPHSGAPPPSVFPVTFITICISGNPRATTSIGSGIPHDADRRYDGAV